MSQAFSSETFDIFSGDYNRDAIWCESVEGIDQARPRMRELGEKSPGKYFLFHTRTQIILDKICTAESGDLESPRPISNTPDKADRAKAG